MPIALELSNLIIPKHVIERKYKGVDIQFEMDYDFTGKYRNKKDNEIYLIARMNWDEFDLDELKTMGLHFTDANGDLFSEDFVIINRYGGKMWRTDWLEDNGVFAWHRDTAVANKIEALKRGDCPMNKIEEEHGSYEAFYGVIE